MDRGLFVFNDQRVVFDCLSVNGLAALINGSPAGDHIACRVDIKLVINGAIKDIAFIRGFGFGKSVIRLRRK